MTSKICVITSKFGRSRLLPIKEQKKNRRNEVRNISNQSGYYTIYKNSRIGRNEGQIRSRRLFVTFGNWASVAKVVANFVTCEPKQFGNRFQLNLKTQYNANGTSHLILISLPYLELTKITRCFMKCICEDGVPWLHYCHWSSRNFRYALHDALPWVASSCCSSVGKRRAFLH